MADGPFKVVAEPEGKNPGLFDKAKALVGSGEPENIGGMVIFLTNGNGFKQEVSRVAWIRRVSKNPSNSFEKQLKIEVEKARTAAATANELLSGAGVLQ